MIKRAAALRYGIATVVGLAALFAAAIWVSENFPQQYATEFYFVKGIIGLIATGLLVYHMDQAWESMHSGAQMARYIMLLFGTIVAGAGSYGQIIHHDDVRLQNIGGMLFLIGVVIVMIYSIIEARRFQ